MNKIKIVCDSLSDISQDYLDLYDIDMLPLSIIIDGVEYKDRIDIDGEKFYKLLREEGVIPRLPRLHMVPSMRILKSIVKKVMISYIFQLLQVLQAPTRVL